MTADAPSDVTPRDAYHAYGYQKSQGPSPKRVAALDAVQTIVLRGLPAASAATRTGAGRRTGAQTSVIQTRPDSIALTIEHVCHLRQPGISFWLYAQPDGHAKA